MTEPRDPWFSATYEGAAQSHHDANLALTFAERVSLNSELCARAAAFLGKALPPGQRARLLRRPENIGLIGYLSAEERKELGLETLPTLTWEEWEAERARRDH